MKVYLAARYARHPELAGYANKLRGLGFEVTSRWILGDHELRADGEAEAEHWARVWADEDREDLLAADIVVSFTEGADVPGRARGGRHVEFGMALETGKALEVIGPRENVFHFLSGVRVWSSWADFLAALTAEIADGRAQPVRVVSEEADASIAGIAQQPTDAA